MFEAIDRIFSLDLSDRGVGRLYEPARGGAREALSLAAANCFTCGASQIPLPLVALMQ